MEKEPQGGLISGVVPGSAAQEIGAEPGDQLLLINDQPVMDLIDYDFLCADDYITVTLRKANGEIEDWELEKDAEEDLGLIFDANVFDGVRRCHNRCLFCFVDQLPPHCRYSLRVKDDDYRMSFLSGNYITCTNMIEADYQRIGALHLSPLYISVHSVDPLLRQRLLGRKEPAQILLTLQRLISLGCQLHTQIVLCPGINDGEALEQTLSALAGLRPGVRSVAVVPVGLTRFQKNGALRPFTQQEAAAVLAQLAPWQARCQAECGEPFVYAADELYLKAEQPFPPASHYGEFAQLEDGVGMAALFRQEWETARLDIPLTPPRGRVGVVCGVSGGAVLAPLVAEISAQYANVRLLPVENSFFGPSVTVSGLLTGSCLLEAIRPGAWERLVIPDVMLRYGERVFLDDMTIGQVEAALKLRINIVGASAAELLDGIWDREKEEE